MLLCAENTELHALKDTTSQRWTKIIQSASCIALFFLLISRQIWLLQPSN